VAEAEAMNTFTAEMSDDAYTLDWLHFFRQEMDDDITSLGRRWLTRMIWHLEERVENDLRGKK
jgi:hypothetical protein